MRVRVKFLIVILAIAFLGLVINGGASALSGSFQPFPVDGDVTSDTVWAAYSNEGEDFTTIELIDANSGLSLGTLGKYDESLNGLGFYKDQSVIIALKDAQFITDFPVNNSPELVLIDADGEEFSQGTIAAPSASSTILSYLGTIAGNQYISMSFRPVFNGITFVPQYRLGKTDLSGGSLTTDWSTILNFSSSPACQAHANAFMAELAGGSEPTSLFYDFSYNPNTSQLVTMMTGNSSTGDLYTTIDINSGAVTCTPVTGPDVAGQSGGTAWSRDYQYLIYFNLEDGSFYKVNPVTKQASLLRQDTLTNLRGDLASNPTPNGFAYSSISGRLTDSNTGQPIANSLITLTGSITIDGSTIEPVTIYTDSDGRYTFSSVVPGIYTVTQTNLDGYLDSSATYIGNIVTIWGQTVASVDFSDYLVRKPPSNGTNQNSDQIPTIYDENEELLASTGSSAYTLLTLSLLGLIVSIATYTRFLRN